MSWWVKTGRVGRRHGAAAAVMEVAQLVVDCSRHGCQPKYLLFAKMPDKFVGERAGW